MVNPFDRTFFRLVLGFSFILAVSFAVLFFVGQYSASLDERGDAVLGKVNSDIPKMK